MKLLIFCMSCIWFTTNLYAQEIISHKPELLESTSPKKRIVLVTTDWCKFCELFKQTSLKDDAVVQLVNKQFIFIELDAEDERTITLNQVPFKKETNQYHELAMELAAQNGKLSFPSLVILNNKNEIVFQHQGYLDPEEFHAVLQKSL